MSIPYSGFGIGGRFARRGCCDRDGCGVQCARLLHRGYLDNPQRNK